MPTETPQARKPKIFIGSSTPGLVLAGEVKNRLAQHFGEENVNLWNEGDIFALTETIFERLQKTLEDGLGEGEDVALVPEVHVLLAEVLGQAILDLPGEDEPRRRGADEDFRFACLWGLGRHSL